MHKVIKAKLFSPFPVALALIFGGVVMLLVEQRKLNARISKLEDLSIGVCFWIGVFQCLSLWPGISRAGSTIIGAMLLGVERKTSAEFSFLIAVPVMIAAVGYDLLKNLHLLSGADVTVFSIGFVTSFVTAVLAIKVFVGVLQRYTLSAFGVYRILLGLLVLWLL